MGSNILVNGLLGAIVRASSHFTSALLDLCFLGVGETALWFVQTVYCILQDITPALQHLLAGAVMESLIGHFNVL